MSGKGSRLQKLLNLIDGGSSLPTRKAAAAQIAGIASAHPAQLPAILAAVSRHLRHKDWDARVAAGHCLGLLAEHFAHHTPADLQAAAAAGVAAVPDVKQEGVEAGDSGAAADSELSHLLSFSSFNVQQVLAQGTPMLASGGEEYELPQETANLSRAEQLRLQRGNLKQRLGLGGGLMEGLMDTTDLLGDEDLLAGEAGGTTPAPSRGGSAKRQHSSGGAPSRPAPPPAAQQKDASQLLASMGGGLSARERAAALRRAKSLKRSASSGVGAGGTGGPSPSKRAKGAVEPGAPQAAAGSGNGSVGAEAQGPSAEVLAQEWQDVACGGRWPFQSLCDQLCLDVLHTAWEVRHGAALALREVLRSQAGAAAVHAPVAPQPGGWSAASGRGKLALGPVSVADVTAAAAANARWLEDCAIHLLCVLALDRFGDFVSDQVVAPVRETAAQAMGAVARPLPQHALPSLLGALRQLSEHSGEWEVRHGGLLGLKYVMAARSDALDPALLQAVLPAAVIGLQDRDDDVQAVAAEALLPAAGLLAGGAAPQGADRVRELLWHALLELEELSPATGSVMALLAAIHSSPAAAAPDPGLAGLVPRLWPFLRHQLASVRLATVRCLSALLRSQPLPALLPGQELQRALRLLFQCLLRERSGDVLAASQAAWQQLVEGAQPQALTSAVAAAVAPAPGQGQQPRPAAGAAVAPGVPVLAALFRLAASPANSSLDASLLLTVPLPRRRPGGIGSKAALASRAQQQAAGASEQQVAQQQQQQQEQQQRRESLVVEADGEGGHTTRMRLAAAQALGQLAHALSRSPAAAAAPPQQQVEALLRGNSATGRLLAAFVVTHWAQLRCPDAAGRAEGPGQGEAEGEGQGAVPPLDPDLQQLLAVLLEVLAAPAAAAEPYAELAGVTAQLRGQASALISRALQAGLVLSPPGPLPSLAHQGAAALAAQVPQGAPADLLLARQAVSDTAALLQASEAVLNTGVAAAQAAAVVRLGCLPPKLNSLIQPLVAAIRREPQPALQDAAAEGLARLTLLCAQRTPCPNDRIIKNVCGFACGDPLAVPSAATPPDLEAELGGGEAGGGSRATLTPTPHQQQQELAAQALTLARRGGEAALRCMARLAGAHLQQRLPQLWECAAAPLQVVQAAGQAAGVPQLQAAVHALHVLAVLAPALHPQLAAQLEGLLPLVVVCLQHGNAALKLAAARCTAALAQAHTVALMPAILRHLTPLLAGSAPASSRLGALLALHLAVPLLGLALVPYSLLVVVPLMGRMSDPQPAARAAAARTFAAVVGVMPLAQGAGEPPGLDAEQRAVLAAEGRFLQQLLDNSAVDDYALPIELNGSLRRYQQEGINWLAFLRRFGLHGVLADDMGLGKTLQTTAMLAAHTHEQRQRFAASGAAADRPLPHLVVCPSTLVAHWPFEVSKFVGPAVLRVLQYHGGPAERAVLRRRLPDHDVVVMSYESLRGDVDWVCAQAWSYCVLDEGHAIRNPASKVAQAAKRAGLAAQHRLLLSGTPVQNNVAELWSLFDFLMPGLLGSERQFNARYGRTLQAARVSKRGSAEAEAGLLAVEGLHRQVTPFVLRRTKDGVLADLPPKIVQDVVVEPSALQQALYQEFQDSQALAQITGLAGGGGLGGEGGAAPPPHVFQSLLYLRKLCSHPLLVLDPAVPQHMQAVQKVLQGGKGGKDWQAARASLASNLAHAPKLAALQQLLLDAGIGTDPSTTLGAGDGGGDDEAGSGGGAEGCGHRVLVFAQLKGLLDLVEAHVLAPLRVSSLRIDGGVEAAERFRRVQRFNADPTIDVMLLTTAVGGLGLNLTAADTVIFLEHDWNPMKDLQAMDRAHRLGQQRTVNVYRLLVRGTLEEQIMSLQRFKLDVAETLVNADNASLAAMDTGNLLDLFTLQEPAAAAAAGRPPAQQQQGGVGEAAAAAAAAGGGKKAGGGGLQSVLAGLGDLEASEAQYADEFSLAAYQALLTKQA
ncbi:hypothetical protein D9Q98_001597 [Chlorella vulgaris]|uniref:Uncharacterized protein n=1 Tax=Chlorella vulgaris TaxID=3077 RepID=A0A9D4TW14_CHLVU|nr:hypothetical protein D9Q98_001597 [Chlorella vulgaris]